MHPAIILKIFRPFFIAIQYLYSLKFSIWFPSQLSICISVSFKNGLPVYEESNYGEAILPIRCHEQRQKHRADAGGPQLRRAGDAGADPEAPGGYQGRRRAGQPPGRAPQGRPAHPARGGCVRGRARRFCRGAAAGLRSLRREPVLYPDTGRAAVHGHGRPEHPGHLLRSAVRLLPQGLPRLHPPAGAGPHH